MILLINKAIRITQKTIVYAVIKFNELITRASPVIVEQTIDDAVDRINLNEANFQMSFTIDGVFDERERKDDERYVRTFVELQIKYANGESNHRLVPYHECTAEDFSNFYPLEERYNYDFDKINSREKGWLCIDW